MATLTDDDWKRVEPLLKNIDPKRQRAAYQHLVRGETMTAAGAPWGYTRQDVNVICKAVLRWFETLQAIPQRPTPPKGWVTVEVTVPRDRADEVRRLVAAMFPSPVEPPKRPARGSSALRVAPASAKSRKVKRVD